MLDAFIADLVLAYHRSQQLMKIAGVQAELS